MSRFLPVGKGVRGAAGFLLAAIPALGAVLTGLAITGGLVGHMARDHPLASYGAFGLAVVVGHAFADVCVVASTSTREPACPAPADDGTVWSQLAVPAV